MDSPEKLQVVSNKKIQDAHYILRIKSKRLASSAKPGQFVQILTNEYQDPLLPRPFSFLDIQGDTLDILYQVVGRGTEILSQKKKGDKLDVLGPLGNGWPDFEDRNYLLVGGGVGIPPIYHWAKHWITKKKLNAKQIQVFLGGRNKKLLHYEKQFKKLGVKLHLATDDGSKGHKGLVTEVLEPKLTAENQRVFACGPTPMLQAVDILCQKFQVPCLVSVEEPMPCGFGACLGCAIKVKAPNELGYRYAISCKEGPVFEAKEIVWAS